MSTTFAELNDRVYLELEVAAEFCQLDKIHNAVVQRHNVRTAQSRSSAVNVLLGVSSQFTPTSVTYDLTTLIGKGVPAWIEYLDGNGTTWIPMRVVSLPQLPDYEMLGVLAAAFYSEESSAAATEPVQYVKFSFLPGAAVRIRFDRDATRNGMFQYSLLPDTIAELIVKEAENTMIPRMKMAIDVRTRNDKELRAIAKDLKQSLSEIQVQNMLEIKQLDALWKVWAFKDRAVESGFSNPVPSGRAMYGTNIG